MKIVIVWFDERRQEICRTPELPPGYEGKIAIPLDAQYDQVIMIVDEEARTRED